MNRPTRKRNHLLEKITTKESRAAGKKKLGKRTKRWRKWSAHYEPIATS